MSMSYSQGSSLILARVHEQGDCLNIVLGFSDGALVNAELPKADTVADIQPVLEAFTNTLKSCMTDKELPQ